ncbi:MAG TPA: MgtC/SapB family protein [Thermoanaerobaculia bacterium]|nr:MgtC/SapB family protein [Thermoanaerobaculia bacterium]
MDLVDIFVRLGIALGLGLLVGLQRERAAGGIAGFRTFPLVTLSGALCAELSLGFGGWVLAAGFLALAALVVVGNMASISAGDPSPGITTEVAVLLMFAVGAFLFVGPPQVAVAVAAATAVLLQLKQELHGFAARLGEEDVRAVMQFAVVTLIVLPILPNRAYGPYHVLNPRQIWWMVVLIVALSLAAYVGYKLLGTRGGTWLAGILGGLVSSTATTVAYARRVSAGDAGVGVAAQVILTASAIVYLRVLVMIGVVAAPLLARAALPLLLMMATLGLFALRGGDRQGVEQEPTPHSNPTELRTALVFGAVFALVLLAVAWAKQRLTSGGLFAVAGLSGLVDLDALTLSTAQLARRGGLPGDLVWRLVVCGSLANLLFKAVVVGLWGNAALLRRIALAWAVALLVGAALVVAAPGPQALLRVFG